MKEVLSLFKNPRSEVRGCLGVSFADELFEMAKAQTTNMTDESCLLSQVSFFLSRPPPSVLHPCLIVEFHMIQMTRNY